MTDDEEKRAVALRAARRSFGGGGADSRGAPAIMTPNGRLFFPSEALLTVFSPLRVNGLLQQFNHSDLGETAHAAVAPFLIDNAGRFESTNTARALQDARLQAEEEKLYAESWEAGIAFRFHFGVAHLKAARLERERDNFKRLVEHHFPFEDFDFSQSTSMGATPQPQPQQPPASSVIPFHSARAPAHANASPLIAGSTNSALPVAAVELLRRPAAEDADPDEEDTAGTAPFPHTDTLTGPLRVNDDDDDHRRRSSAQIPRVGPAGTAPSIATLIVKAGRTSPSLGTSPASSRANSPNRSPIVASLSKAHRRHRAPPRLNLDEPTAPPGPMAAAGRGSRASMSMGSGVYNESAALYSTEAVLGVPPRPAAAPAAPAPAEQPAPAADPPSPVSPKLFRRNETKAFAGGSRVAANQEDDDDEVEAPAEQHEEAAVAEDSLRMIDASMRDVDDAAAAAAAAIIPGVAASPTSVAATMPPSGPPGMNASSSVDGATLMECFTRSPTNPPPAATVGDWTTAAAATGGGAPDAPTIGVEPASGTASMNASASGMFQPFNARKHVQAITTVVPQSALGNDGTTAAPADDEDGLDDDLDGKSLTKPGHSPQKPPRSPRRSVAFDESPVQATTPTVVADQRPPIAFAPPTLTSWDDVLSYSRRNGVELPPSLLAGLLGSGDPPQPLLDLVAAVLHNAAVVQRDAADLAQQQHLQRQRTDSLTSASGLSPHPPVQAGSGPARGKRVRLLLPGGGSQPYEEDMPSNNASIDANHASNNNNNDGGGGGSPHGSFNSKAFRSPVDRRLSASDLRRSPNPPLASPNTLGSSATGLRGVLRHAASPMSSPASPGIEVPGEAGLDATGTVAPPSGGRRKRREDRAASARRWSTVRAVSRVTSLFRAGGTGPNPAGGANAPAK